MFSSSFFDPALPVVARATVPGERLSRDSGGVQEFFMTGCDGRGEEEEERGGGVEMIDWVKMVSVWREMCGDEWCVMCMMWHM